MRPSADVLWDFAVEHPDGFTFADVERELGWDYSHFAHSVHELRLALGDDDELNLACKPRGRGQRWLYKLVGHPDDDTARVWHAFRMKDVESTLETMGAVATSIMRGTDGRTMVGRKARMVASTITHLRETLAVIDETP